MRTPLNALLIVGFLIISTVPLFAQAQQPDAAKLKADAQVVSIISGDKAKTQTYCQISIVIEQISSRCQAIVDYFDMSQDLFLAGQGIGIDARWLYAQIRTQLFLARLSSVSDLDKDEERESESGNGSQRLMKFPNKPASDDEDGCPKRNVS